MTFLSECPLALPSSSEAFHLVADGLVANRLERLAGEGLVAHGDFGEESLAALPPSSDSVDVVFFDWLDLAPSESVDALSSSNTRGRAGLVGTRVTPRFVVELRARCEVLTGCMLGRRRRGKARRVALQFLLAVPCIRL